jgi:hypothetical protein
MEGNHAAVVDVAHEHKRLPPAPIPAELMQTKCSSEEAWSNFHCFSGMGK